MIEFALTDEQVEQVKPAFKAANDAYGKGLRGLVLFRILEGECTEIDGSALKTAAIAQGRFFEHEEAREIQAVMLKWHNRRLRGKQEASK